MDLTATTTIRKPRSEIYSFWKHFENLPTFMAHLDQVRTAPGGAATGRRPLRSAGPSSGTPRPTRTSLTRRSAGTRWERPTSRIGGKFSSCLPRTV